METNLSNLSDRLTDKNYVLDTANKILRDMLFSELPAIISKGLYAGLILVHVEKGVDKIFKYASSPIQRIWYSAIFLSALKYDIFFVNLMPPLHSATEQMETVREVRRLVVEGWRNYQKKTGELDMDSFLYYMNNVAGLPEEVLNMIPGGLELSIFEYCRTYFLSLQSTFLDLKIQEQPVKTNILIWSLYQPDFKLLVECDEMGYYADKASFTADRARDRLLQAKGYQVLRFSGREIISNPLGKAEELMNYLWKHRIENQ